MINGWTASGLVWPERVVAALERDHRVIRIDNRGSGWSRHAPRPYTIGDLAADARRIIDDLGLGAADRRRALDGRDDRPGAGAALARPRRAARAARHPPAEPRGHRAAGRRHGRRCCRRRRRASRCGASCATGGPRSPGPASSSPTRTRSTRWRRRSPAARRRGSPCSTRPGPSPRGREPAASAGSTVPTTVVHGTEDPLIPVRNGMRIAQLIPGARYVELPDRRPPRALRGPRGGVERIVRDGF